MDSAPSDTEILSSSEEDSDEDSISENDMRAEVIAAKYCVAIEELLKIDKEATPTHLLLLLKGKFHSKYGMPPCARPGDQALKAKAGIRRKR